MSDGGDCRTAPATPGLLIIKESINDKADCKTAPATPSLLIKCAVMFSAFSTLQCAVTQRLPPYWAKIRYEKKCSGTFNRFIPMQNGEESLSLSVSV